MLRMLRRLRPLSPRADARPEYGHTAVRGKTTPIQAAFQAQTAAEQRGKVIFVSFSRRREEENPAGGGGKSFFQDEKD